MIAPKLPAWLSSLILWAGLLLCGAAAWQHRNTISHTVGRLNPADWITMLALMLLCCGLGIASWQQYLSAYTHQPAQLSTASRQHGLLLVGKYLPGGIFGFLARIYDGPTTTRRQTFWAGLVEQANGLCMIFLIGALLYTCASSNRLWPLLMLPTLPLLAIGGSWALHNLPLPFTWLRSHHPDQHRPRWGTLGRAASIQFIQLLTWAGLAYWAASQFNDNSLQAWLGLTGAFMLAVGLGIIAFFIPGGIGVRETAFVALCTPWNLGEQAIVLAAVMRIISTGIDVIAGTIGTLASSPYKRQP